MTRRMTVCGLAVAFLALGASRGLAADEPKALTDEEFLKKAASDGITEVVLGRMATERAENADVKKFGERMDTDHSKGNRELMAVATKLQVSIPKDVERPHQEMIEKLKALKGAEFDRAYMEHMVMDHEKAVALFTDKSKNAKDDMVKQFAAKQLPTLKEHLQMARDIAAKVKGKQ